MLFLLKRGRLSPLSGMQQNVFQKFSIQFVEVALRRRTLDFIADSGIQVLTPPPYSPDLARYDFLLFPTVKKGPREKVFGIREELISAVNEELEKIERDFAQCFQRWLHRLEKCIAIGGEYVEQS